MGAPGIEPVLPPSVRSADTFVTVNFQPLLQAGRSFLQVVEGLNQTDFKQIERRAVRPGDEVIINDEVWPKYIRGARVKLEQPEYNGSWLGTVIDVQYRAPRNAQFRPGRKVRVNESHLLT